MMTPMGVLPASTDSEVVVMALAFSYDITEGMELVDKMLNAFTDMLSGFGAYKKGTEWGGEVVVPGHGKVELTLKYGAEESINEDEETKQS